MAAQPPHQSPGDPQSAVRILPPEPPRAGSLAPIAPPPRKRAPNGLMIGAAIVVAIGSLLYGYRLGEGNRSEDDVTVTTAARTAPTAAPPTTAPVSPFEETVVEFSRGLPGHDVPEGATEYLDGNIISALAVAPDGFLWSAGPGGVIRWNPTDGSYERYTSPDGTGPIGAQDIAVAPDGDVWVRTNNGLSHWDGAEWVNDSDIQTFGPEHFLNELAVDADGTVWVASIEWEPAAPFAPWPEPRFLIHRGEAPFTGDIETWVVPSEVFRLETGPDGAMWALMERDIWRFVDGRWELAIDVGMQWVHDIALEPDGAVLLAGERRVQRWAGGALYPVPDDGEALLAGTEGQLGSVAVDEDGVVWVTATSWDETTGETRELIRLDDLGRFRVPDHGFSDDLVAARGALWSGGEGLTAFDGETWSHFRISGDPPLGWPESIAVDQGGSVWVASDEQLIEFDGTAWNEFTRSDFGLPELEIGPWGWEWQPAWVAGGGEYPLWAGFGCYTISLQGVERSVVGPPQDIEDDEWCWAEHRMVGPDGALWMVTEGAFGPRLFRTDGSTWSEVDRPQGMYLSSIALAPDGTVWASGDGVMRLDGDEWRASLRGIEFQAMTVGGDGSVWAAEPCWGCSTEEARLWRMVDGAWNVEERLNVDRLVTAPDGSVWAIGRDGFEQRGLWLHDPDGIFRHVMDGELSALAFAPDGSVWVAAEGRLLHLQDTQN